MKGKRGRGQSKTLANIARRQTTGSALNQKAKDIEAGFLSERAQRLYDSGLLHNSIFIKVLLSLVNQDRRLTARNLVRIAPPFPPRSNPWWHIYPASTGAMWRIIGLDDLLETGSGKARLAASG